MLSDLIKFFFDCLIALVEDDRKDNSDQPRQDKQR